MAYLSGKRGDEIGRFGLGFKSVLAVTDAPQVFSRSVSFEFNSSEANAACVASAPAAQALARCCARRLLIDAARGVRPATRSSQTWRDGRRPSSSSRA